MNNLQIVSLKLDKGMYQQLKVLAAEDSRSTRNYISVILQRHVAARMNADNIDNPDFKPPGLRTPYEVTDE